MIALGSEKSYELKIRKFLTENGWYVIKFYANGMTKSGIPDLLCCSPNGRFVAIEVKAEHGTPSELQIYNINEINKRNGVARILYPKDWDDFKRMVLEGNL